MDKDTLNERPTMRGFMNVVRHATNPGFGRKPAPAPEHEDDAAARRTATVTQRANDEKKGYGFLRSIANKTFGKKAPEPAAEPESRPERSEDERRKSVIDRAKDQ